MSLKKQAFSPVFMQCIKITKKILFSADESLGELLETEWSGSYEQIKVNPPSNLVWCAKRMFGTKTIRL
jgi:hypothetical protein